MCRNLSSQSYCALRRLNTTLLWDHSTADFFFFHFFWLISPFHQLCIGQTCFAHFHLPAKFLTNALSSEIINYFKCQLRLLLVQANEGSPAEQRSKDTPGTEWERTPSKHQEPWKYSSAATRLHPRGIRGESSSNPVSRGLHCHLLSNVQCTVNGSTIAPISYLLSDTMTKITKLWKHWLTGDQWPCLSQLPITF